MVWITTIDFPDDQDRPIMGHGTERSSRRPAMELNEYALQMLADEKLRNARAQAARRGLLARVPRRTLRARLGSALIAVGERLLAAPLPAPSPFTRSGHG